MTELSEAMERLINDWSMTVTVAEGERVQEFPPLVDMLHGLVSSSRGGTTGGATAPSARNLLDPNALDLLISMQDVTRAWLQEWGVQGAGELKLDLRGFWDRLHTLHRTHAIDEALFDHLLVYPDQWAAAIWDLVEPPRKIAMRAVACPKCGAEKAESVDGDLSDAVSIILRDGHEPTAVCTAYGCDAVWIGRSGLIDLGRALGIPLNVEMLEQLDREATEEGGSLDLQTREG